MKKPTRPVRSNTVAWRMIGDEAALVPTAGKRDDLDYIYVISEVGAFIWGLMDGEKTTDQLVARVVEEFEVSQDVASRDLRSFLDQLAEFGAVLGV
jgi:hypothetical protein